MESNEAEQQFKSEMYARQLVKNAFGLFDKGELEGNEQARDIYERLREDLKVMFDEFMPISPRCPVCGKFRKEPTKGLMPYELADRLREAYERQAPQLDAKARTLWEQLDRLDMIAVCAELLSGCVVLTGADG